MDPSGGITNVPVERWEEAQRCEYQHWFQNGATKANDRNYYHLAEFDGYKTLAGLRFAKAIELGCGPFTNLRLIGRVCQITSCDLLDPLLEDYLKHPNRFMERKYLSTAPLYRGFSRIYKIAPSTFRNAARIAGRAIPISNLFSVPIEQMPQSPGPYDLIVMINVLEHCLSVDRIFDQLDSISLPGSIFVFADRGYDNEEVRAINQHFYDAAHPLRIPYERIEEMLSSFDCLYRRTKAAAQGPYRLAKEIYFIGRRRLSSTRVDV